MAMSNDTKESGGLTDGNRMNHSVATEQAGKGQLDNEATHFSVPTKPPRRKTSLLDNLRKSFNEFRPKVYLGASKSEVCKESSKKDKKTQCEKCDSKLPKVKGADIEGIRVDDSSSEITDVDLGSSLPDADEKLASSHSSLNGELDASKTGNEVDKIDTSLFYIVQHFALQAVTLQRKTEEDWGIILGQGSRPDCYPSSSLRNQDERSNHEKAATGCNFNNHPDSRKMPGLKYPAVVTETVAISSAKSDPYSRRNSDGLVIALQQNLLRERGTKRRLGRMKASTQGSSQPRHGVRIIGLTEGGVAERCGQLAVEDLIVEVNGTIVLDCSVESVTAAIEQFTRVNLVVSRKKDP